MDRRPEGVQAKQSDPTPDTFMKLYQRLCEETGFMLVAEPLFIRRDDNTFSIIVRSSVQKRQSEQGIT